MNESNCIFLLVVSVVVCSWSVGFLLGALAKHIYDKMMKTAKEFQKLGSE